MILFHIYNLFVCPERFNYYSNIHQPSIHVYYLSGLMLPRVVESYNSNACVFHVLQIKINASMIQHHICKILLHVNKCKEEFKHPSLSLFTRIASSCGPKH